MRAGLVKMLNFHSFFETTCFCNSHADFSFVGVDALTGIICGLMYILLFYCHFISLTLTTILSNSS